MTPQLQQAIKLLQLSNIELASFVETELERNPLLERAESDETGTPSAEPTVEPVAAAAKEASEQDGSGASAEASSGEGEAEAADSDEWVDLESGGSRSEDLDAEPQDVFPDADSFSPGVLKDSGWSTLGQGTRASGDESSNLESYVAEERTLRDHLTDQLVLAFADPARAPDRPSPHRHDRRGRLSARRSGRPRRAARRAARTGRGHACRDAGLRPVRRLRPRLARMPDAPAERAGPLRPGDGGFHRQSHLLAVHDLAALKRAARVSDEDLHDMIKEVRRLNPKPGLKYRPSPTQPIVPDVLVRALPDGSFHVELNSDTLPRVLVNQSYYATVSKSTTARRTRAIWSTASRPRIGWSRASTSAPAPSSRSPQEIVRQQDAFLTYGVAAPAAAQSEDRCRRDLHARIDGQPGHRQQIHGDQSRPVRAQIFLHLGHLRDRRRRRALLGVRCATASAQMIEAEPASDVLSDDKIVERLKCDGVDIARRTVAKYREALRIPSSVQRRRLKRMAYGASL